MASERYSERVQKITREGGAGSMEKPKIAFDVDGVLGDFLYQYSSRNVRRLCSGKPGDPAQGSGI